MSDFNQFEHLHQDVEGFIAAIAKQGGELEEAVATISPERSLAALSGQLLFVLESVNEGEQHAEYQVIY
jgi:hypothetical protein